MATKTKQLKPKLPFKLWRCLEIALADLEKVEKDKKHYVVAMNTWHSLDYGINKCAVCLAGSVLAKTFKVPLEDDVCGTEGEGFHKADSVRFNVLDDLRHGNIHDALSQVYNVESMDVPADVKVTPYVVSPTKFKRDMVKIVKILKKLDL